MVSVVAHRGFSGKYPENTEIAFMKALELGVETIELDVRLSRDMELIVIHDSTVDRTSDGSGIIDQMTLREIKAFDAGSWFRKEFEGQRFLTFSEALDLIGKKVALNVHVKPSQYDRQRIIPLTIQQIEQRGLLGTAFIASDQESIEFARRIQPGLDICNLSKRPMDTYINRSLSVGCRILQPSNKDVDIEFVSEAHNNGMEVNPFHADDAEEMKRLTECGVDGMLTNYPDRLLALRRRL